MADFSFVNLRLATGAGINSLEDALALEQAGVTHIIDCRDDFDDAPYLTDKIFRYHTHYFWNGTPDNGERKSPRWFFKSINFALEALSHNHSKVYAHCAAGINRGPSTIYAILRATGLPMDVSEQMIRQARPQVGLAYKNDADSAIFQLGME